MINKSYVFVSYGINGSGEMPANPPKGEGWRVHSFIKEPGENRHLTVLWEREEPSDESKSFDNYT
jgi:hypothetical protein